MTDRDQPGDSLAKLPTPAPDELLASDAERERAVDRLRDAAGEGRLTVQELDQRVSDAYSARTVAALTRLTADVTLAGGRPATTQAIAAVNPGPGGTGTVISIMGGHDRQGHWRVAPRLKVINVMGGSDLDLTSAELSDQVTTITIVTVMGGGEIRMPDGAEIQVAKLALMGANDVALSDAPPPIGAPVIRLRLLSIMGGFKVRQGRKLSREEKRRRRELRKAADRGELPR